jgi:hypothetical protein
VAPFFCWRADDESRHAARVPVDRLDRRRYSRGMKLSPAARCVIVGMLASIFALFIFGERQAAVGMCVGLLTFLGSVVYFRRPA